MEFIMNFEEWYEATYNKGCSDSHRLTALTGWNAAIEESIKVAKEGHNYTPTSTAHNIAKRIKELKE